MKNQIITTSDIQVAPGARKEYTVKIIDMQSSETIIKKIVADNKKDALCQALKSKYVDINEAWANERWVTDLYNESLTWFDYEQRLLDVDINASVE